MTHFNTTYLAIVIRYNDTFLIKNTNMRCCINVLVLLMIPVLVKNNGLPVTHSIKIEEKDSICVLLRNDMPNFREYITSVVYAESKGEHVGDMDGQKAILDAIRWRERDNYHPNNAYSVVTQPGQFDGKWQDGWKDRHTDRWIEIDELVCNWIGNPDTIYILPEGFRWFHNPRTSDDSSWVEYCNTRDKIIIGNHTFTN